MDSTEINQNLNFRRALDLLKTHVDSPEYLITFWRAAPSYRDDVPMIENRTPWYDGLENLL